MQIAQVGEQVLRTPAQKVSAEELSSADCQGFINELKETMLAAKGIGIAAPQVFDPRAIMVIASRPNARYPHAPLMAPLVLVNPAIKQASEDKVKDWEGCLSVPGLRGMIERSEWIDVEYLDVNGKPQTSKFEGFVARIFQHEFDHLIGKTWLDRVANTDDIIAESVWLKTFTPSTWNPPAIAHSNRHCYSNGDFLSQQEGF